jgi:hypothetical protein
MDDMRGAGQEKDMRLGPQEDDQGASAHLGRRGGAFHRHVRVRGGLGSLGQEALGVVIVAVFCSAGGLGRGLRGCLDGEAGQQRLDDLLLLDLEVEHFAHNAAS